MPKFNVTAASESALESRSDSTRNLLLKMFSSICLYQTCTQELTPHFSSLFPLSFKRRQMGEGNQVLLGLKLFYVWAGNAI